MQSVSVAADWEQICSLHNKNVGYFAVFQCCFFEMISSLIFRSACRNKKVFFPLSYGTVRRIKYIRVSFLTTPAHTGKEKSELTNQWPFLKQNKAQNLASNAKLTEEQKQVMVPKKE